MMSPWYHEQFCHNLENTARYSPKTSLIPYVWYMKCQEVGIVGMRKSPYLCTQKMIKVINSKSKSYEDNESNANARVLLLYDGNEREYIYNRY